MMRNTFIHITTDMFQKTENEDNEVVNAGMYGKNLAEYIQRELRLIGYSVPFYCNEDWGWWVEIKGFPCAMGVCIYGRADNQGVIHEYVICSGLTDETTPFPLAKSSDFLLINNT